MNRLQLLGTFQVLSMPSGAYGGVLTHANALDALYEWSTRRLTVPGTTPPDGLDYDGYLAWWEANSTPCCEECDGPMPEEHDIGWALVCEDCAENLGHGDGGMSDYNERMAERRAMGLTDL